MPPRLVWVLILAGLTPAAQAQTCMCDGPLLDHYEGGDKNPLAWAFRSHLAKPSANDAPPWLCYFKSVSNKSRAEVRRVTWEVAGFYRRFISAGMESSSCPVVPGEMKAAPRSGPLFHGISDRYDTTVREPKDGWKEALVKTSGRLVFIPKIQPEVRSGYDYGTLQSSFIIELAGGTPNRIADVRIASHARPITFLAAVGTELLYELINAGNAPIRLLINLPHDDLTAKEIPAVTTPVLLKPQDGVKFITSTQRQVGLQVATVVFYDALGEVIVAIESAGFYGLTEGSRTLNMNAVWSSVEPSMNVGSPPR
jgi:hypothetical protein